MYKLSESTAQTIPTIAALEMYKTKPNRKKNQHERMKQNNQNAIDENMCAAAAVNWANKYTDLVVVVAVDRFVIIRFFSSSFSLFIRRSAPIKRYFESR